MLNRNGGHIFLGVNDKGNIIGVPQDKIKNLKKDFANLCNNSQKIYPNVYLEIQEYQHKDKIILYIYVYESSDVHRSANKIFDRNQDGDYDITNNTSLVANLYIRKSNTYLENNIRISIRNIIARELCVNLLIHRELSNPYPAKLIITKNSIITENANKPKTIGYIDLNNYASYPKNPKIASVFKEIGLAEEFGSGIKKITKYSKIYGGKEPVFYDDDIFRAEVVYNNDIETSDDNNIYLNDNEKKLYEFIKSNNGVTRKDINDFMYPILNSNDEKEFNNKVRYMISKLKNDNLIENIGSDKYSIWK